MFTGIVTDIGRIQAVRPDGDTRFEIATAYDTASISMGASISCDGACLTVTEKGPGWFAVTASAETLNLTTLSDWRVDHAINLERALRMGDELGGHIVTGHVDGVAEIRSVSPEGDSLRFRFQAPDDLMPLIAPKGSVTLNGVSLTVNEVDDEGFGVNIIPHTQSETTFGAVSAGDRVNLEVDVLARYVARLSGKGVA